MNTKDSAAEYLDALPTPVLTLDCSGAVLQLNRAAIDQLGEISEMESSLPRLFSAGYDDAAIKDALERGEGHGEAWSVSTMASGNRALTLTRSKADLDRRKRLARTEAVFDGLSDGIFLIDPNGKIILANHTMKQEMLALGMEVQEGTAYVDIVRHRMDAEGRVPEEQRAMASEQVANLMMMRCKEEGITRIEMADTIVEVHPKMINDDYLLVYHDATERENQAHELRRSMERYRRVIEDQTEMICRYNSDLILTFANPRYKAAFSTEGQELIGTPILDFVPDDETRDRLSAGLKELSPESPIFQDTHFEPNVNGAPRWVAWSNRALFDEKGALIEYQAVGRDITAEHLAQEALDRQNAALVQSEKMAAMGSLLASVSHELNNPLSIVLGQSEILESLASDEATQSRAARIKSAAERCGRIVRTFLSMARRREAQMSSVDIPQTIDLARSMVIYAYNTSSIELEINIPESSIQVMGDGDQLVQVFVNMLLNAQQAMEETTNARKVTVSSETQGDTVLISIEDTGPGIPPDVADQIFEPFFTTKPEGVGTGIGLSLCKNITEAHGGALTYKQGKKGGAVFTVSLPLAETEVEGAEQAEWLEEWTQLPPLNILLVDDETEVAQVSADFLRTDGHRLELASDGQSALDLLQRQDFDLVLSDIRMPGLDGPGLWEELSNSGAFPVERIGFLTGDTLGTSVKRFLDKYPVKVLNKPFHRDDLRKLILELLAVEV